MSRPIAIRNTTSVEQYVLVDNRRYNIPAYQVRVYDDVIAKAFLERCAPRIVKEGGVGAVEEDRPRFERIYLYNVTGDPDAPATVKATVVEKGLTVLRDIPNPIKDPVPCRRSLGGGEESVTVGNEGTSKRLPPRDITIHPWTRKAFEKPEADWMLNREGMRPALSRTVARSRPPTNFEPDDTWSIDDMIAYAKLIDPRCKVVPSEKELRTYAAPGRGRKEALAAHFGEMSFRGPEEVIDAAKDLMLRRLFFRVANPMFTLPSREEFMEYLTRPEGEVGESLSKKGSQEGVEAGSDFDMEAALKSLPDAGATNARTSRP